MFCCNCGSKLPDNAKYCDNCGDLVQVDGNAVQVGGQSTDGNDGAPDGPIAGQTPTEGPKPLVEIPQAPIGSSEGDACKKPSAEAEKPHENVAFAFGQAMGVGKNAFSEAAGSIGGQNEGVSRDDASSASIGGVAK